MTTSCLAAVTLYDITIHVTHQTVHAAYVPNVVHCGITSLLLETKSSHTTARQLLGKSSITIYTVFLKIMTRFFCYIFGDMDR